MENSVTTDVNLVEVAKQLYTLNNSAERKAVYFYLLSTTSSLDSKKQEELALVSRKVFIDDVKNYLVKTKEIKFEYKSRISVIHRVRKADWQIFEESIKKLGDEFFLNYIAHFSVDFVQEIISAPKGNHMDLKRYKRLLTYMGTKIDLLNILINNQVKHWTQKEVGLNPELLLFE